MGGEVYGRWSGLNDHQLNEGRDLALTTDFRLVLGEILTKHIGVADLKPVFPQLRDSGRMVGNPDVITCLVISSEWPVIRPSASF
jgi:uncharacterized protein (DUF1501 family)